MEKNRATKKANAKTVVKKPEKSKKLLSIDEYFLGKPIRKEKKAAIKIKLKDNEFHSRDEWEKIIRKLEG